MSDTFHGIFDRAVGGDPAAVETLLQRHLHGLRAFVRLQSGKAVRQRESCSDLVQSVCREVLEDLSGIQCRDEAAFRHWLYTVARNKILHRAEYYRAQRRDAAREVDLAPADRDEDHDPLLQAYHTIATPSRHAVDKEEIERIESAMDALPDADRDVILRSRLLGQSHRQIADELGKTEPAVRKMLSRARARLGILLDGP